MSNQIAALTKRSHGEKQLHFRSSAFSAELSGIERKQGFHFYSLPPPVGLQELCLGAVMLGFLSSKVGVKTSF